MEWNLQHRRVFGISCFKGFFFPDIMNSVMLDVLPLHTPVYMHKTNKSFDPSNVQSKHNIKEGGGETKSNINVGLKCVGILH